MFKKTKDFIHNLYYEKLYKQIHDESDKKLRVELKITQREKDRYSRLCKDLEKKIDIYDDAIESIRVKSGMLDEIHSHIKQGVKYYTLGNSHLMKISDIINDTKKDIKTIEVNNGKILKIDRKV